MAAANSLPRCKSCRPSGPYRTSHALRTSHTLRRLTPCKPCRFMPNCMAPRPCTYSCASPRWQKQSKTKRNVSKRNKATCPLPAQHPRPRPFVQAKRLMRQQGLRLALWRAPAKAQGRLQKWRTYVPANAPLAQRKTPPWHRIRAHQQRHATPQGACGCSQAFVRRHLLHACPKPPPASGRVLKNPRPPAESAIGRWANHRA